MSMFELSYRTNINSYSWRDKYVVVYDDHRTLLNVLFEAKRLDILNSAILNG